MRHVKKALALSLKKVLAFPYEIYLVALYASLSVLTTLLFWRVLFSNAHFADYPPEFIYILAMVGLLADGLCEIFFGLRDLDYLVRTGEFDRYLIRPRHPMYLLILENIPLIPVVEKLLLSLASIAVFSIRFGIPLSLGRCLKGLGFLAVGVAYYQIVYGLISVLAFRVESIGSFRDLLFQVNVSKQYPMSIFPAVIRSVLTYVIPVSLLAYYPTVILLGLEEPLPPVYGSFGAFLLATPLVYRWSLAKYSSNGG